MSRQNFKGNIQADDNTDGKKSSTLGNASQNYRRLHFTSTWPLQKSKKQKATKYWLGYGNFETFGYR